MRYSLATNLMQNSGFSLFTATEKLKKFLVLKMLLIINSERVQTFFCNVKNKDHFLSGFKPCPHWRLWSPNSAKQINTVNHFICY